MTFDIFNSFCNCTIFPVFMIIGILFRMLMIQHDISIWSRQMLSNNPQMVCVITTNFYKVLLISYDGKISISQ